MVSEPHRVTSKRTWFTIKFLNLSNPPKKGRSSTLYKPIYWQFRKEAFKYNPKGHSTGQQKEWKYTAIPPHVFHLGKSYSCGFEHPLLDVLKSEQQFNKRILFFWKITSWKGCYVGWFPDQCECIKSSFGSRGTSQSLFSL